MLNFEDYVNNLPLVLKSKDPETNRNYHSENSRLYLKFRNDVQIDLGLEDNPKFDKTMNIAYSMCHSGGYSEIYNYAAELAELIE